MSTTNIARWIGIGLLGLPLHGALTCFSSFDPQPDPATHYEAWSRFVTTDHYVLSHVLGSTLGLVFAIFATFALGAYLASGRSGRLGLVAMVSPIWVRPCSCRRWGSPPTPPPRRGRPTWRA
jgi:hypothetical protein